MNGRKGDAMNLTDKIGPVVVEIEHETNSAEKNPNGPWVVRGTIKVDLEGATVADVIEAAKSTWKIKRQNCRQRMSRENAVKHLNSKVSWRDVGKAAVDVEDAFKAKFASMTVEERKAKLEELEKLLESGFGK